MFRIYRGCQNVLESRNNAQTTNTAAIHYMIMNAVVVQKSSPNTAGLPGGIKALIDGCVQRPPLNRPTFGDVLWMLIALEV